MRWSRKPTTVLGSGKASCLEGPSLSLRLSWAGSTVMMFCPVQGPVNWLGAAGISAS